MSCPLCHPSPHPATVLEQNLADCLGTELPAGAALEGHAAAEALDTFLVYNQRRKVRSHARLCVDGVARRLRRTLLAYAGWPCWAAPAPDHCRGPVPVQPGGTTRPLLLPPLVRPRPQVTSSAKRKLTPGSTRISQTPDGSFYSLQQNAAELLARCGVAAPPLGGVRDYLRRGPGFLFLFHPGLGPMWEVVAHKVQGGALAERAEVQLEVAELSWRDVSVAGSLLVRADTPLGHLEAQQAATGGDGASGANSSGGSSAEEGTHLSLAGLEGLLPPGAASNRLQHLWPPRDGPPGPPAAPALSQPCAGAPHLGAAAAAAAHCSASVGGPQRLVYSDAAPRVRLHNVLVRNRGIDWSSKHNVYWRHKVRAGAV